jgi:hypothetical protein
MVEVYLGKKETAIFQKSFDVNDPAIPCFDGHSLQDLV